MQPPIPGQSNEFMQQAWAMQQQQQALNMRMLTNTVGKVSTPPLIEATEEGPERASITQTDCHHDIITTGDIESVGLA